MKRNVKKNLWILLALILVMALVAGCGAKPAADEQAAESAAPTSMKIGMLVWNPSIPFTAAQIVGAKEKAKELGIELLIGDGHGDNMQTLEIIDNFITQEIDGFIMGSAEDTKAVVPGIEKLNAAGIPVMALDNCPEGGKVDLFISFDIQKSSERAAAGMIEGLKKKNGGTVPAGTVIEIMGSLQDAFAKSCSTGFHAVVDQYPQLKVAQGEGQYENDVAFERTTDLMTRYGDDVVAIYVHTPDIMATGVASALEALGKNPADYFISGICLGPEGVDLMKKGQLFAVVQQPAYDSGKLAVQYLADLKAGIALPKIGDTVTREGETWSPAPIVENPYVEGAYMVLQGPLVGVDVQLDDPRLWENMAFATGAATE